METDRRATEVESDEVRSGIEVKVWLRAYCGAERLVEEDDES